MIGLLGVLILAMASEINDQVSTIAIGNIQGGLAISHDPATWFSSLYISAEIVGMAFSPWMLVTFSLRRWTLFVVVLCGLSSVLIPFSPDIAGIYALRILQGLAGGFAIPLLMTTALRVLTPDIRLYGLAVYALTATFTPGIAAPLAALWTDLVGWRFVFYQAIPYCLLAGTLAWYGLPQDPPQYQRFRIIDWRGMLLLIVGFGAFSTMLYQGNRLDWFNSHLISVLALVSAVAIPLLLVNEWFHPMPLLKLQLLGRPNLCYGCCALFCFLLIAQSGSTVPFNFLREVQGFRPEQYQGLTLLIAAAQLVMLPAVAWLLDHPAIDARAVHLLGLVLIIASCIGMSLVNPRWEAQQFVLWQSLQAVGQPMVVMTLLMLSTNSITKAEEGPFASALVNVPRAISEATGAWLFDLINRWRGGLHYNRIVDQIGQNSGTPLLSSLGSPGQVRSAVQMQATVLTLSDAYLVLAAIAVALALLMLLLAKHTLPPRLQLAKH